MSPDARPGPPEMTCKELVELVTDYVDGVLPAEDCARFERHLAVCPPCRTYLEQMRQTIALSGKLSEETIEPRVRDELLRLFRDWKRD